MKNLIVSLILIILPIIVSAQFPAQKIINGDTLVVLTKKQADELNVYIQKKNIEYDSLITKHERLKKNHQSLIEEYAKVKNQIKNIQYQNDSLLNFLGTNMALLYKENDSSSVKFVDLKYYTVDVFREGTIFLTSITLKERERLNLHLIEYPQWRFINIKNEMSSEYGQFIGEILLTNTGEMLLYRID